MATDSQALASLLAAGARATVQVTMRDEKGASIRRWRLTNARPLKYTGPTLSAKGTDVAVEELSLTANGITSA